VFATGYKTNIFAPGIEITGTKGTLADVWEDGARAYHGTSIPGFPNFFIIVGPNSVTGNSSVLLCTENHVNYALRVLKPVLTNKASVVEVTEEAEQKWETAVQENLGRTVYNTGTCNSVSSISPKSLL
jgi:cation diffusion facilitator CzcD-associated flavoprotein CzcO